MLLNIAPTVKSHLLKSNCASVIVLYVFDQLIQRLLIHIFHIHDLNLKLYIYNRSYFPYDRQNDIRSNKSYEKDNEFEHTFLIIDSYFNLAKKFYSK
jgi:hypothetical protein